MTAARRINVDRHRWANGYTAERTDAWRHEAWAKPKAEEPRREVTAAERTDAPVCVALAGYDPERVEQMRVGWAGMEYAR